MKKTPLLQKTPLKRKTPLASTVKVKPFSDKLAKRTSKVSTVEAKKAKLPSRSSLVKKMDKLVSQIVCFDAGYKCVQTGSCENLTCGHVFSRRSYATRFDIHPGGNCYCQSWAMNWKHVHDNWPYFHWFIGKFGNKAFMELRKRYDTAKPVKTSELREKYEYLKSEASRRGL